jgi:hypothetical protein
MSHLQRLSSPVVQRLLLAALMSLPLGSACSSDEAAPEAPSTFGVSIVALDGEALGDAPVALHCDGTLAVEVGISSEPEERPFIVLPSRACGVVSRCGYVRLEALDSGGGVLARVDTAATTGLLRLPPDRLAELSAIRASLIRGIDDEPVLNPDQSEVSSSIAPTFQVPTDCPPPDLGAGGTGPDAGAGAGGGGAAPLPLGGAPTTGGAPAEGGALGMAGSAENAGAPASSGGAQG